MNQATPAQEAQRESDEEMLDRVQRSAFQYFLREANAANGLVLDCTKPGWPASIAAVGFALSAYPVGVERGWMERAHAVRRTLTTLRFFHDSPQGTEPDATGHRGFYYHFLDMNTGRRAWKCELSTIDTALLLAGVLNATANTSTPTPRTRWRSALSPTRFTGGWTGAGHKTAAPP